MKLLKENNYAWKNWFYIILLYWRNCTANVSGIYSKLEEKYVVGGAGAACTCTIFSTQFQSSSQTWNFSILNQYENSDKYPVRQGCLFKINFIAKY